MNPFKTQNYFRVAALAMGLVFALANVAVPATAIAASVPSIISYQGRLTDASGNLLGGAGTAYYFKFSLWTSPTVGSGTRLWPASAPSTTQLNVKQGVFNANIGDTANGYPDALNYNFTTSNVYLQVEVSSNGSSFETLAPRQQVSSTAYAQVAGAVSGVEQSTIGTTTPASDAVATIESTTTNAVALVIRGSASQAAKIVDVRNALGSSLFSVNASGGVNASSTLQVTGATTLYGTLAAATASFTGVTNTGLSTLSGGILANSASSTIANLTMTDATSTNATTTSLYIAGQIRGAGLVSCSGSSAKLIWNSTTGLFGCGVDAGGSGSGLTAIGAQYSSYQTGATQTLATTSDANIQLTITSTLDTHTFSPSWVGTLAVGRGGTGLSSVTNNQLLVGGPGNTVAQIATSSLGLLTTDVAEGSNLYYTPARVDVRINATTSIGTLIDLPNLARSTTTEATTTNFAVTSVQNSLLKTNGNGSVIAAIAGQDYATISQLWSTTSTDYYKSVNDFFSTTSANYWDSTLSRWATTSSDYFLSQRSTTNLPEGSNLYFTPARADARINATTTLGTLQFLPNLVAATATDATTSSFAITNIPSSLLKTNGQGSVIAAIAGSDYAKASDIIGKAFELSNGYLMPTTTQVIVANGGLIAQASSTVMGNFSANGIGTFANILANGSSTLQNFTALNATTSQATTTALAISGITNSLLKANGNGSVVAAVAGQDYAAVSQLWATTSADYYNSQFRNFSVSGGYLAPTTSIALRFPVGFVSQASSTNVGNFTITGNSTTTNATTTAFAISSITNSLLKTNGNGSILAATAGADYAKASDIIGKAWEITNGYLAPTSTAFGILVNNASSTITNLQVVNGTTTNATSTNLAVSSIGVGNLVKTSTGGLLVAATAGTDFATIAQLWATTSENYFVSQFRDWSLQGSPLYLAPTTSRAILINNGTSTITNLQVVNGTTTNATSTNLAVSSIGVGNLVKTSTGGLLVAATAGTDFATPAQLWATTSADYYASLFRTFSVQGNGYLAPTTSRPILINNASSTITNLQVVNGTTTNATSTNLAVSSIGSGSLVKTSTGGLLVAATAGADYAKASDIIGKAWEITNGYLAPTSTAFGILVNNGTSTITNLLVVNGTTTNATSTNSVISGSLKLTALSDGCLSTAGGLVTSTGLPCGSGSGSWATTSSDYYASQFRDFNVAGGYLAPTTSRTILANLGFVSQASSTIVGNLTITGNSTTTNATTTAFAISSINSSLLKTNGNGSVIAAIAGQDYAKASDIIGKAWEITNGYLAPTSTAFGILVNNASSTITNLLVVNGTTTNATSTNSVISGSLKLTALSDGCLSTAGGLVTSTGAPCGAAAGSWGTTSADYYNSQFRNFALTGGYLAPTTSQTILANNGFVSQASSTIVGNLNITGNSTTTNATTTALAVSSIQNSLLKTNGQGSILAAVAGQDYATIAQLWATTSADYYASQFRDFSVQGNGYLAPTTSRPILINNGTSTITNLQVVNGTTTNATSTNLAVSSIGVGNLVKTSTGGLLVAATAGTDFATPAQLWATTSENYYTSLFNAFSVQGNGYLAPTTSRPILINNASSTITNLQVVNGTTTNATSTNLAITGQVSKLLVTDANGLVGGATLTGGLTLTNGTLFGIGTTSLDYYASQFRDWSLQGSPLYLAPTTSRAILVNNGTSTITNLQVVNGTTTNATSTNLAVSSIGVGNLVKTSTGGLLVAATAGTDFATIAQLWATTSADYYNSQFRNFSVSGGYLAPTTSRTILANLGFVSQASSTIVGNLTITGNSTTTNATTTALAVSSIQNSLLKTNGQGSLLAAIAGQDYATIAQLWATTSADYYASQFRDFSVQGNGYLAPTTSRAILINNGTSTITNLQVVNGTTTNATSTNLAVSSIGVGNLVKTSTGGLLVAATAGTDFATPAQLWATTSENYYTSLFNAFSVQGNGYLAPTTSRPILINNASSTITNLQVVNGTTTNATSTNLAITGQVSKLLVTDANGLVGGATLTGGLTLTNGTLFGIGTTSLDYYASQFRDWSLQGSPLYLAPTTSRAILVNNGTSTITNLQVVNGTTTNATSTNLAVSSIGVGNLVKTSTGGLLVAATAGTDFATIAQLWATTSENYFVSQFRDWSLQGSPLYLTPTSTTRGILVGSLASSTLYNLTTVNSTSTYSTTTGGLAIGTTPVGVTGGSSLTVVNNSPSSVPPLVIQNLNSGASVSTNISLFNDNASAQFSFGVNSTGHASPNAAFIWQFANAPMRFGTNGTERLRIDSNGNISTGASTTPWAQLSVNPDRVPGPEFVVGSSTKTDFIVTNGGLVGVGTTTPTAKFEVNGLIYSGLSGYKFPDGTIQTTASTGGGGYATIQDEGGGLTQRTVLNFTGSGISCVDNSGNTRTDCTVNAGAASAGGVNGQVQFNDSNSLGGANVNYVKATGNLGVGTTSPLGRLSVASANSVTSQPLFIVASSSLAIATTTPFIVTNEGDVGIGSSSPMSQLSVVDNSANTATIINQQGTGNLFSLQQAGVDKFTVANNGSLTISAVTNDLVKSTTGASKPSDFSLSGSSFVNTSSNNNKIDLNDSTSTAFVTNVGAGMFQTTISTTTPSAMGAGGHVILREDGKYVVIHGGGTAVSVWNGFTSTMTPLQDPNGRTMLLTGNVGAGAISLRRPDGRYLVIHGGGVNTSTILDPYGRFPPQAGPTGNFCTTANTGTNAFQRTDGRYVVMCGGVAGGTTAVYDPNANTFAAGPSTGTTFGAGAHSIQRDDGTFLVFAGGGSTGNFIYNPNLSTTNIGAFTQINPLASPPTITTGAFSIRRADGKFLVLPGASGSSYIYDPSASASTTAGGFGAGVITSQGFGPSTNLLDGAQSIWRQDGTYLLFIGASSAVTNIIDPSVTTSAQFTAGPSLPVGTLQTGATAVMTPNGHYAIIGAGSATNSVTDYDMGYVMGGASTTVSQMYAYYESECMTAAGLNPHSTLVWHTANEGTYTFQAKTGTGSCSGDYKTVQNSGDNIKLDNITDNRIQVRVYMQRNLPKFYDQEWNIRKSGQTRYRRNGIDPAIYDFLITNGTLYKRNFIDFANNISATSTATSSIPVSVNLQIRTDGIGLSYSNISTPEYNTTVNATNVANFNGTWATSTPLNYGVASSTIVMRRPDGNFVILVGASTSPTTTFTAAQLYNPNDETITNLNSSTTAPIGAGALAFKRQDGKFVIVLGNNSTATTTTNIYDPITNTFSYGPPLTGNAGKGALVIPLPTGKYLIVHGNYSTGTTIYDPFENTTIQGIVMPVAVGEGSLALPRPDGTYLVAPGTSNDTCTNAVTTYLFDPNQMNIKTNGASGSFSSNGTGPGTFAFQRSDGLYVIFKGGGTSGSCIIPAAASNNVQLYNPFSNRMIPDTTGITPPTPAASLTMRPYGGFAMPMADGSWVLAIGSGQSTKYNLYVEKGGVEQGTTEDVPNGGEIGVFYPATGGPTAIATSTLQINNSTSGQYQGFGPGAIGFQRPDGKFMVIVGDYSTTSTSTVTAKFDAGWVSSGLYKTEEIQVNDLDSNSVLNWKVNPSYTGISAEVRTATSQAGLQDAPARSISSSGQKINPGPGETWLQVTFNFQRNFPSYSGIYSDVWYSGATPVATQRNVATPVLTEISVTKDIDFLNLQADGATMLRISSNGNLYAADGATLNTSGADLAERYTSQVPLENGTVVSIDPQNNHGVMPTTYQYQPDALGVVSTDPGFVAGAYTKDSYPIALIGRVPVKVSTENGLIRTGDKLTPSSVPGYAMKATLAGHVIGHALESFDPNATTTGACPESAVVIPGRQCGTIMMFVNLMDYLGEPVNNALTLSGTTIVGQDAFTTGASTTDASSSPSASSQGQILGFLEGLKVDRANSVSAQSEVFANRVNAISEIISPAIFTDSIRANSIAGLDIVSTKKIAADEVSTGLIKTPNLDVSLDEGGIFRIIKTTSLVAGTGAFDASSTDASSTEEVSTTSVAVSFDTVGNGLFAGSLTAQGLTTASLSVSGTASFTGLTVNSIGTASTSIDFMSDVNFFGRPYFTSDTAGSAIVKAGAKKVDIVFDRQYIDTPIVSAMIALEASSTTDDLENLILNGDVRFIVTKKDVHGFSILLNRAAPADIEFSWIALAVKNAKLFTSVDANASAPTSTPDVSAGLIPPPTPASTSTPTISSGLNSMPTSTPDTTSPTSTLPPATSGASSTSSASSSSPSLDQATSTVSDMATSSPVEIPPPVESISASETDALPEASSTSP